METLSTLISIFGTFGVIIFVHYRWMYKVTKVYEALDMKRIEHFNNVCAENKRVATHLIEKLNINKGK